MTDQTKTTSELLKTLNEIRALEGKEPIAKWKRSRSDLETLLKTYDEEPEADPLAEDQPEATELGKAIADVVLNAEDLTAPEQLEQLTTLEIPAEELAAPSATVQLPKSPRGAIGIMVMDLLQTDMPYKDIVKQVRGTYWDAKTTERSVASIAMDLRRDGVNVPARRKPAAIKQVVAAVQAAQPSTEVPERLTDQA